MHRGFLVVALFLGATSCGRTRVGTFDETGDEARGGSGPGTCGSQSGNAGKSGFREGAISVGTLHSCALLSNGNVRCWGSAESGQLGYGNIENIGDDETPASVGDVHVGDSVVQVAAGFASTCALLANGNVRCWGWGYYGQLGYGNKQNIGDDEVPASAGDVDVGGSVARVSVGGPYACALLTNGSVRCWGWGFYGELGYGNRSNVGDDETPASVGNVDVGGSVTQIAAGGAQTCALLTDGNVRCWGYASALGYGNTGSIGDDETPASAGDVDVGDKVLRIVAGGHVCALLANERVRCWGPGANGQLGYGNTSSIGDDETPASAGDVPYR